MTADGWHVLSPTTGPITLKESYSKTTVVTTTVKFTLLVEPWSIKVGDIISLKLIMPADKEGFQETKYSKFAKVKKIKSILSTDVSVEVHQMTIVLAADTFRSYDHDCATDCDNKDCRGEFNLFIEDIGTVYAGLKNAQ